MSIRYDSLDEAVRHCMVAELDRDIQGGNLYISSRLTEAGALEWPSLLHCSTRAWIIMLQFISRLCGPQQVHSRQ